MHDVFVCFGGCKREEGMDNVKKDCEKMGEIVKNCSNYPLKSSKLSLFS